MVRERIAKLVVAVGLRLGKASSDDTTDCNLSRHCFQAEIISHAV
jgi:hypothetical protein